MTSRKAMKGAPPGSPPQEPRWSVCGVKVKSYAGGGGAAVLIHPHENTSIQVNWVFYSRQSRTNQDAFTPRVVNSYSSFASLPCRCDLNAARASMAANSRGKWGSQVNKGPRGQMAKAKWISAASGAKEKIRMSVLQLSEDCLHWV